MAHHKKEHEHEGHKGKMHHEGHHGKGAPAGMHKEGGFGKKLGMSKGKIEVEGPHKK